MFLIKAQLAIADGLFFRPDLLNRKPTMEKEVTGIINACSNFVVQLDAHQTGGAMFVCCAAMLLIVVVIVFLIGARRH